MCASNTPTSASSPHPTSPSGGGAGNHQSITHHQFILILLIAAITLGVGARVTRYAANLNLWGDEAYVAVNIVERTPAELMQPLNNRQVAPPMWLWAARGCWKAFDSLDALRLPAFISGLATLGVFTLLARRVSRTGETAWAVTLFAASYPLIRYSAEAKPYASDSLATTIILTCAAYAFLAPPPSGEAGRGNAKTRRMPVQSSDDATSRSPLQLPPGGGEKSWPLWLLAMLLPALLWLSYPAVIVTAGVGIWAIIMLILRRRDPGHRPHRRAVVACVITAGVAAALLGLLVVLPARHQADGFMQNFWQLGFPPVEKPWRIPWWLLKVHTGKMMGYPFGDKNFGSTFTTVLFLAGAIAWWQSRRRAALTLLLAVMLAALAAACAGVYPYGVHVRIMLFLSPVICLLAGAGIERIARWIREDHAMIWRVVLAMILLIIPIAVSTDVIHQGIQQNKLADVAGVLRWVDEQAAQHDAPIYCYNTLDPHTGSGPKIEFELYMMTQLRRPVQDGGRLPGDYQQWVFPGADLPGPGAIFFAIVYDHTNESAAHDAAVDAWLDQLDARASVIARRNAMMALDSGGALHVFKYEVKSQPPSPVPGLLPLIRP
ncbi:MAG: hypothetical protein ACYC26_10660 [Phycisphaerales bacterium]